MDKQVAGPHGQGGSRKGTTSELEIFEIPPRYDHEIEIVVQNHSQTPLTCQEALSMNSSTSSFSSSSSTSDCDEDDDVKKCTKKRITKLNKARRHRAKERIRVKQRAMLFQELKKLLINSPFLPVTSKRSKMTQVTILEMAIELIKLILLITQQLHDFQLTMSSNRIQQDEQSLYGLD